MNYFFDTATLAMTGFFMLSGYSLQISYSHKQMSEKRNLKEFYLKRLISIYPLYIVVGFLSVAMKIVAGLQTVSDNVILLPVEMLGIQSFFNGSLFQYAHNGGTWFISCILICYFIYPLFKELLNSCSLKKVIAGIVFLAVLLSYVQFLPNRFDCGDLYTNSFLRLLEFVLGMLIAKVNIDCSNTTKGLRLIQSNTALILSIVLVIAGISYCNHVKIRGDLLMYLCFVIMFFSLGSIKATSYAKWNKALLYTSGLSYAFYLSQFLVWNPTKFLQMHIGEFNNLTKIIGTFAAVVIISVVLHSLIESKFRGYLKEKLL